MATVKIQSINQFNEIEWTETIKSERSMRAAKNQATRWMRRELFASDCADIKKQQITKDTALWQI